METMSLTKMFEGFFWSLDNFIFMVKKIMLAPIERSVRTIKERCRSTCNSIQYRRITIIMVRSLVEGVVNILNYFPSKNGLSNTLSPSTIVEGKPKMDFGRDMISFGSYALVYQGTSNNMKPSAFPAIYLKMPNLPFKLR